MTDFSNLIDWAKRVYPIENYDTYEEWEGDVVDDLEDSGHMPKKTDNLFSQLEKFWKDNKKEEPQKREKELEDFVESELPSSSPKAELPERQPEPELPLPDKQEDAPIPEPIPRKPVREPEPEPIPKKKPSIRERISGGLRKFAGRFRRKKK